jgi:hypothetical protein
MKIKFPILDKNFNFLGHVDAITPEEALMKAKKKFHEPAMMVDLLAVPQGKYIMYSKLQTVERWSEYGVTH